MTLNKEKSQYDSPLELNKINAVIFDLGGVILNLDYQRTVFELQKLVPSLDANTFYGKEQQLSFYSHYEIGKITSSELLQAFNRHYQVELNMRDFEKAWNAMILNFPANRIDLIKRISTRKKVFLLSNINALHEEAVDIEYAKIAPGDFRALFENVYYSHLTGMRKPDPQTFQVILDENKISVSEVLFIDDSHHHILGAQSIGIPSVHLSKPQTLEDLLSELNL